MRGGHGSGRVAGPSGTGGLFDGRGFDYNPGFGHGEGFFGALGFNPYFGPFPPHFMPGWGWLGATKSGVGELKLIACNRHLVFKPRRRWHLGVKPRRR